MAVVSVWKTLGISRTADRKAIRRAYAQKLKLTNPEDDPEGFKALRQAYESALGYADGRAAMIAAPARDASEGHIVENRFRVESLAPVSQPPRQEIPTEAGTDLAKDMARDMVRDLERDLARDLASGNEARFAFFAARRCLAQVLAGDAGDQERIDAVDAVLNSPALDAIELRAETEDWLAQLILEHTPRSDIVIERVARRFNWEAHNRQVKRGYLIGRVLVRRDDAAALKHVKVPGHAYYKALRTLSAPPRRPTVLDDLFGHTQKIKKFLEHVRSTRPSVLADLNPQTVAQWNHHFENPPLSSGVIGCLAAAPFLVALEIYLYFTAPEWPGLIQILFVICVLLPVALYQLAVFLCGPLRKRWRGNQLMLYGWGPAAIAVLLLAAAPASWMTIAAVAIGAFVTAVWATLTGDFERHEPNILWLFTTPAGLVHQAWWWSVTVVWFPRPAAIQMAIAIFSAIVVSVLACRPLLSLWSNMPRGRQFASLGAIAFLAMVSGLLLWAAWDIPSMRPLAASAVVIVSLLCRIFVTRLSVWSRRVKWSAPVILIPLMYIAGLQMAFVAGGLILLGLALIDVTDLAVKVARGRI